MHCGLLTVVIDFLVYADGNQAALRHRLGVRSVATIDAERGCASTCMVAPADAVDPLVLFL